MVRTVCLLLLCLLGARAGAAGQDIGMACSVKGRVEISHGANWTPLRVLQRLSPGDKIRCAAGAEAVVVLFGKGERFQIGTGKTATVQDHGVQNAASLGGLKGPSERAANLLAGSRSGASGSRAPVPPSRLFASAPGWLPTGERHVPILEIPGAAAYVFSLYDTDDVLLWSVRSQANSVDIPADIKLQNRTAYVWRLNVLNAQGRPVRNAQYRWGTLTFLTHDDIGNLTDAAGKLKPDIKDSLPYLLLAAECQDVGAYTRAWEVIEDGETYGALDGAQATQARTEILQALTDTARLAAKQFENDPASLLEIGGKR